MTSPDSTKPCPTGPGLEGTPSGIELRHLRYFLAVFDELHFGRAAKAMRMAQPPLSQAIRRLEDKLGVQLFERTSRVVHPTEAGSVFAQEARRVLGGLDVAVAAARRAGGMESHVRIGCVHDLPLERLLRFLAALKEADPSVRAGVTHLSSVEQVRRLRTGELDLAIFHAADEHSDIEARPLFPGEPMVALLAAGHDLAAKRVLEPSELQEETLVTFSRTDTASLHNRVLEAIEAAGYRFRDVYEVGADVRDLLPAVAQNMGVAFAPASVGDVSDERAGVMRRPVDPSPSMPGTVVAWHVNPVRQPKELLETVRLVARNLAQSQGMD